jgi:hypothetical protein
MFAKSILPTKLSCDLNMYIFNFIETNLVSDWKKYFSEKVLLKISPKEYFSKQVLPKINKGYRLVGLSTKYCESCAETQTSLPECQNCVKVPCNNCYWYNFSSNPMSYGCWCADDNNDYICISWKNIKDNFYYRDLYKYDTYEQLLKSNEYKEYLEEDHQRILLFDNHIREVEREYRLIINDLYQNR